MDPKYHYISYGEWDIFLKNGAPLEEMGLPAHFLPNKPMSGQFVQDETYKEYDENGSSIYTEYLFNETHSRAFINFVLNAGPYRKYLISKGKVRIARVPIHLRRYASVEGDEYVHEDQADVLHVEVNTKDAMIAFTKKMLENPTPEAIAILKEQFEYLDDDTVFVEDVETPFS